VRCGRLTYLDPGVWRGMGFSWHPRSMVAMRGSNPRAKRCGRRVPAGSALFRENGAPSLTHYEPILARPVPIPTPLPTVGTNARSSTPIPSRHYTPSLHSLHPRLRSVFGSHQKPPSIAHATHGFTHNELKDTHRMAHVLYGKTGAGAGQKTCRFLSRPPYPRLNEIFKTSAPGMRGRANAIVLRPIAFHRLTSHAGSGIAWRWLD
jgi:hypothetical protein